MLRCRVNQDILLRFTEIGWQVWNMWAVKLFESCSSDSFHPLGTISEVEVEDEEYRINSIQDGKLRVSQRSNFDEIMAVRDSEEERYKNLGHSFRNALLEITKTMKAFGVRPKWKPPQLCGTHSRWCCSYLNCRMMKLTRLECFLSPDVI